MFGSTHPQVDKAPNNQVATAEPPWSPQGSRSTSRPIASPSRPTACPQIDKSPDLHSPESRPPDCHQVDKDPHRQGAKATFPRFDLRAPAKCLAGSPARTCAHPARVQPGATRGAALQLGSPRSRSGGRVVPVGSLKGVGSRKGLSCGSGPSAASEARNTSNPKVQI